MTTKTTKKTTATKAGTTRAASEAKTQRALREAKRASDANIKAIDAKQKTAKPPKRPSGLDLAAKALADAGEPLNAKTIAERVIAAGWKTNGKTPHATLYAAIAREISTKGKSARFRKADRGLFTTARNQV